MPVLNPAQLEETGRLILTAAGVSEEEARTVAGELRDANLVGHDSHGVMRLMQYVTNMEEGHIKPGAEFEVVAEGPSFCIADAHFNFGQVAAARAVELGTGLAREAGTATVMVRNCNHVGRLGSWSRQAALAGFASMMCVNAPGPGGVAPWGGIDRRLGTNPITMAAPRGENPLVLDMTTSATAEGKLRVAFQKGEDVPEGLIIDAEGRPTTHPADFYADPPGALLPLGGPLGFKGYGMSVMVDLFGGILSGSGVCRTDLPRGANGVWMYFIAVDRLVNPDEYATLLEKYIAELQSSRLAPGFDEILVPGEIEDRRHQERLEKGVSIPDETWRQLNELATRLGTDLSGIAPA